MLIPDENKIFIPLGDGRYAVINCKPPEVKNEEVILNLQSGESISIKPQRGLKEGKIVVISQSGVNIGFNYEEIVDTLPRYASVCALTGKIDEVR